ncbi:hypothetical protein HMPREF1544_03581 [Mucor circinelloides 1006PhL]|uniref:Uncharacterized protein n=1 Tax=Mucor circinelloides f. circinelloides (strain 1006PhL) TaxID=1220926 RepID=S2JIC1_MUCC1|nr:hypothetical protein HMPREF1544_03581 [Mucor circinelloides 1006PhL]KAG1122509.1 hypothetical protein G6F42_011412 [Rhizopus arrhizus]
MSTELKSSQNSQQVPLLYTKERLLKLYGVDLFAAVSSAAMVSPFIAVVDRSIIENLNGKRKLVDGLKFGLKSFASNPFQFATSRQFGIVLGLYFSTYATANFVDTTCEQYSVDATKAPLYKFAATSIVNIFLCVYKDKVFASMFGVSASKALPKLSYLLFAARDSLTIAASFTAPTYIANALQNNSIVSSEKSANVIAQLVCPAAVQLASTPVHLYALDLYNRPGASLAMRGQLIKKEYVKSTLARIGRIGPAFGIGGVGNTFFRSYRTLI